MKRLLVCIMVATFSICIFAACGKGTDDNENSSLTQMSNESEQVIEETTVDAKNQFPTESKMARDIDKTGKNAITFPYDTYTLTTASVEIEKASQEEKKFTVYCYANQECDSISGRNYYQLVYNYYEIGGWVLDECYLITVDLTPKSEPRQQIPDNEVAAGGNWSYELIKTEKVDEFEYIYHYKTVERFNYMDLTSDAVVYCNFDNTNGWDAELLLMDRHYDFSRLYGTWYGEYHYGAQYNGNTATVVVKNVDFNNGKITLDIKFDTAEGLRFKVDNGVYDFCYSDEWYDAKYEVEKEAISVKSITFFDKPEELKYNFYMYFDENYGVQWVLLGDDWVADKDGYSMNKIE